MIVRKIYSKNNMRHIIKNEFYFKLLFILYKTKRDCPFKDNLFIYFLLKTIWTRANIEYHLRDAAKTLAHYNFP